MLQHYLWKFSSIYFIAVPTEKKPCKKMVKGSVNYIYFRMHDDVTDHTGKPHYDDVGTISSSQTLNMNLTI